MSSSVQEYLHRLWRIQPLVIIQNLETGTILVHLDPKHTPTTVLSRENPLIRYLRTEPQGQTLNRKLDKTLFNAIQDAPNVQIYRTCLRECAVHFASNETSVEREKYWNAFRSSLLGTHITPEESECQLQAAQDPRRGLLWCIAQAQAMVTAVPQQIPHFFKTMQLYELTFSSESETYDRKKSEYQFHMSSQELQRRFGTDLFIPVMVGVSHYNNSNGGAAFSVGFSVDKTRGSQHDALLLGRSDSMPVLGQASDGKALNPVAFLNWLQPCCYARRVAFWGHMDFDDMFQDFAKELGHLPGAVQIPFNPDGRGKVNALVFMIADSLRFGLLDESVLVPKDTFEEHFKFNEINEWLETHPVEKHLEAKLTQAQLASRELSRRFLVWGKMDKTMAFVFQTEPMKDLLRKRYEDWGVHSTVVDPTRDSLTMTLNTLQTTANEAPEPTKPWNLEVKVQMLVMVPHQHSHVQSSSGTGAKRSKRRATRAGGYDGSSSGSESSGSSESGSETSTSTSSSESKGGKGGWFGGASRIQESDSDSEYSAASAPMRKGYSGHKRGAKPRMSASEFDDEEELSDSKSEMSRTEAGDSEEEEEKEEEEEESETQSQYSQSSFGHEDEEGARRADQSEPSDEEEEEDSPSDSDASSSRRGSSATRGSGHDDDDLSSDSDATTSSFAPSQY